MSDTNDDPTLIPPTAPPVEGPPVADGDLSPPDVVVGEVGGVPEAPAGGATLRTWIVAGAAAIVMAIVAFVGITLVSNKNSSTATTAAASADTGSATDQNGTVRRFGGGTGGTIAAIDGSTITLTAEDGTTTKVATSDATTVTSSATASLSDVAVGDYVSVMGTVSGADVTAERITDTGTTAAAGPVGGGPNGQGPATDQTFSQGQLPADGSGPPADSSGQAPPGGATGGPAGGGRFGPAVRGQVTSVNGSTLVVTGSDGTAYTVTASSTTTVDKVSGITVADLSVGQQIQVIGATGSDGTVSAERIIEGDAAMTFRGGPPPSGGTTPTTT